MHTHSHGPAGTAHRDESGAGLSSRRRLVIALSITGVVLVAQLVAALASGSLALAADAGHMAVDSSGLVVALVASHLVTLPRTDRRSWGWARSEVLAAALQAGMLLVITVLVIVEGVERLLSPTGFAPVPVLVVGSIGLVANALSLLILAGGRGESLNMRGAFLEVAMDTLGSLAVILSALITLAAGWMVTDAVASLLIAALMAPRALSLLRATVQILMEVTPDEIDTADLRGHLAEAPGVVDVHDLHVSTIATGTVALTAHLTVSPELTSPERDLLVKDLHACVAEHFALPISHATFQLESEPAKVHESLHSPAEAPA